MGNAIETIIILLLCGHFVYVARTFAPWAPSRSRDMERVLRLAKLQPGEKLYDL